MTRRRLLVALLLLLALALLLAGLWAWRARHDLTRQTLLGALAARGAAPASLRVVEVGPGGLEIEDLRVGEPPALEVERLTVELTPSGLGAGRLAAARARGVRLRGRLGPDGLDLGAAQELLLGADDEEAAAPLALPARHVALQDARVELETPAGALTVVGDLEAWEEEDGALRAQGEATLRHRLGRGSLALRAHGPPDALEARADLTLEPAADLPLSLEKPLALEARFVLAPVLRATLAGTPVAFAAEVAGTSLQGRLPALALEAGAPPDGPIRATLRAEGGRVEAPGPGLRLALEQLEAAATPETLEATLDLALHDLRETPRLAPLHAALRIEGPPTAPQATLELRTPEGAALARIDGGAELGARGARLRAHLQPVDLASIDLARRIPALAALVGPEATASGEVEAHVDVRVGGPPGLAAEVDLALRDVHLTTELAGVEGLHGRLELSGPPWRTPEPQILAMARLDLGLVLDDGRIELLLDPETGLQIREAVWRFAGGRLRAGADLGYLAQHQRGVLVAENLDVASLVALVDVEGLEGTGTLAGALPVFREGERLEVRGGVLRSLGGGRLRWKPPGRAALAGRQGMDVLLTALEDLHYDRIELGLDGDLRGDMDVALHLRGSNPNLQGGRPVELNLNVDARLADLVSAGRASYRVPEIVEERLRDFSAGRSR